MREPEIVLVRAFALLLAVDSLGLAGCKSEDPVAEPATQPATPKPEPSAGGPAPEPSPSADDPERLDKLADLDAMCKALDHDYVDGTLTDYYRDVRPRTAWGKAQRDAGNESIQPGRLLEKAVAELSPDAKDPALGNCRTLLDYLDDVE